MTDTIPLYLFTYNCSKLPINEEQFTSKLQPTLPSTISNLYVFGFQEICSVLDGSFNEVVQYKMIQINQIIINTLKKKYGNQQSLYTLKISHIGAMGIILVSPYTLRFGNIHSAIVGSGYFGSSMKGAVGVRLEYFSNQNNEKVELTFLVGHLPAGEGEHYYQKRNNVFLKIMRSMEFEDGWSLLKPNNHCFIMGDLNYRTTKNYKKNSVQNERFFNVLNEDNDDENEKYESLLNEYDELSQGRSNGDILTGFSEGCIKFKPTYKYIHQTAIYNQKRSPSWCDRIFYQSTYELNGKDNQSKVIINKYNSISNLLNSDHQPVYLDLIVPVNPPRSIISPVSGYLQILPSELPNVHSLHMNEASDNQQPPIALQIEQEEEVISGPTQIYMKSNKLEYLQQNVQRPIVDLVIGWGLWLSTTPRGRIELLISGLLLWIGYYFYDRFN